MKRPLNLSINGHWREDAVAENTLLIDYLREQVGLTAVAGRGLRIDIDTPDDLQRLAAPR